MSNNQKNHYGSNVSWFCYEGSLALNDFHDQDGYVLADFDIECDNGSVNVDVIALLESASVVIDEQSAELKQLRENAEQAKSMIDSLDVWIDDERSCAEWVDVTHIQKRLSKILAKLTVKDIKHELND